MENAEIIVINVGGGGQKIEEILRSKVAEKLKLVAANADVQVLEKLNSSHKLQFGP